MSAETKEWVRVSHGPTGTLVTVTLQEGAVSARWTAKTYITSVKSGLKEARAGARNLLTQLAEAMEDD